MKNKFSDYTEEEFIQFMEEILKENESATDDQLDPMLEHFEKITEHPDGTDLIYYAESDSEATADKITQKVKEWRKANGLPGFKI